MTFFGLGYAIVGTEILFTVSFTLVRHFFGRPKKKMVTRHILKYVLSALELHDILV